MYCPKCKNETTVVYRTMRIYDGKGRRRYRRCIECGHEFTTIESLFITTYDLRGQDHDRH